MLHSKFKDSLFLKVGSQRFQSLEVKNTFRSLLEPEYVTPVISLKDATDLESPDAQLHVCMWHVLVPTSLEKSDAQGSWIVTWRSASFVTDRTKNVTRVSLFFCHSGVPCCSYLHVKSRVLRMAPRRRSTASSQEGTRSWDKTRRQVSHSPCWFSRSEKIPPIQILTQARPC